MVISYASSHDTSQDYRSPAFVNNDKSNARKHINERIDENKPQLSNTYNNSFTVESFADSPYFDAFASEETQSFELLSKIVKDIREKTDEFYRTGNAMATATRQLSVCCQFRPPASSAINENEDNKEPDREMQLTPEQERIHQLLGPDVANTIDCLGKVLTQIASAQEKMCKMVESALGSKLEQMIHLEVRKIAMHKQEVKDRTENAERIFFQYLNGKHAGGNLVHASSLYKNGYNSNDIAIVDSHIRIAAQKRVRHKNSHASKISTVHDRRDFNIDLHDSWKTIESDKVSASARTDVTEAKDNVHSIENIIGEWKQLIENVGLNQGAAEFRRFQMYKYVLEAKCKCRYDFSTSVSEACEEMQTYFVTCAQLLKQTSPKLNRNKDYCAAKFDDHTNKIAPLLEEQEKFIIRKLSKRSKNSQGAVTGLTTIQNKPGHHEFTYSIKMDKNKKTNAGDGNQKLSTEFKKLLEDTESALGVWVLPIFSISIVPIHRETIPDIIMEGWLYECQNQDKFIPSSKILKRVPALPWSSRWKKRWCYLRSDGIYGRPDSSENNNPNSTRKSVPKKWNTSSENDTSIGTKICDIYLCTLRELPDDPSERFCFEISCPCLSDGLPSYTYSSGQGANDDSSSIFQARGPDELRKWVNAIRSASTEGHSSHTLNSSAVSFLHNSRSTFVDNFSEESFGLSRYTRRCSITTDTTKSATDESGDAPFGFSRFTRRFSITPQDF